MEGIIFKICFLENFKKVFIKFYMQSTISLVSGDKGLLGDLLFSLFLGLLLGKAELAGAVYNYLDRPLCFWLGSQLRSNAQFFIELGLALEEAWGF